MYRYIISYSWGDILCIYLEAPGMRYAESFLLLLTTYNNSGYFVPPEELAQVFNNIPINSNNV